MVLRSRPLKCTCSDQITFKEFSFNFSFEVSVSSRRQCKVSPKKMNTNNNAEKPSLHLKHLVHLVSAVEVAERP